MLLNRAKLQSGPTTALQRNGGVAAARALYIITHPKAWPQAQVLIRRLERFASKPYENLHTGLDLTGLAAVLCRDY